MKLNAHAGLNYSMWNSITAVGGDNRPKLQLEWCMPACGHINTETCSSGALTEARGPEGIRGTYLPGFFGGARPAGFPRGVWLPLRAVGNMSLATDAERWPLAWGGADGIYMGYWNRLVGVDRAPYNMACTFPLGTRTQHIGDDICNLRTPHIVLGHASRSCEWQRQSLQACLWDEHNYPLRHLSPQFPGRYQLLRSRGLCEGHKSHNVSHGVPCFGTPGAFHLCMRV